jgi:hypothetical protein
VRRRRSGVLDAGSPVDGQPICPECGKHKPAGERFCESCGLPLIPDLPHERATGADDDARRRARKIKPQLAEGRLVRVAYARNLAEAEFIQGLLLEQGVPSLLRRSAGFDVPDFLAAGPRDVLVAQSGVAVARETLMEAELIGQGEVSPPVRAPMLAIGLLCALAIGALVIWLLSLALG